MPRASATDMRRDTLLLVLALATATVLASRWRRPTETQQPRAKVLSALEASPACPWRDPRHDLLALFPPATNCILESRIVSRMTAPIVKRLGRPMTADENPLRIYRVSEPGAAGSVLVTRVKGESGAIEIVIGVHPLGEVHGVLVQSQRESEAVARIIASPGFLDSFAAKNASSPLRIGEDLPAVPEFARVSAQAIADGVRSELIVLSFAEMPLEARESGIHTNH